MDLEQRRADRANPPGAQPVDDQLRVRDCSSDADQRAGGRQGDGLEQQQPANGRDRDSPSP